MSVVGDISVSKVLFVSCETYLTIRKVVASNSLGFLELGWMALPFPSDSHLHLSLELAVVPHVPHAVLPDGLSGTIPRAFCSVASFKLFSMHEAFSQNAPSL